MHRIAEIQAKTQIIHVVKIKQTKQHMEPWIIQLKEKKGKINIEFTGKKDYRSIQNTLMDNSFLYQLLQTGAELHTCCGITTIKNNKDKKQTV